MATKLLRLPQVEDVVGYRRSTIYRLIKQGEFPAPISLSKNGRASAWVQEEIFAWAEKRIAESRASVNPAGGRSFA